MPEGNKLTHMETLCRSIVDMLEDAVDLTDFQPEVEAAGAAAEILAEAGQRIQGALDLHGCAFYLYDEKTQRYSMAHCAPQDMAEYFDTVSGFRSKGNGFVAGLGETGLDYSAPGDEGAGRRLLLQPLASCERMAGVFVGISRNKDVPRSAVSLLRLILRQTANALSERRQRSQLTQKLRTLRTRMDALANRESHSMRMFEDSPLALALVAPGGQILDINPAFVHLFGYSALEAAGLSCSELVLPEPARETIASLHESLLEGQHVSRDMTARKRDGQPLPVSFVAYPLNRKNRVEALVYSFQDATTRKAHEEQLTYKAFHDSLTGLPNRALFFDRLERALTRRKRDSDHNYAIFLLDLDRFKGINDSMGHLMGDRLLQEIAGRLAASVRDVDTVARLGGDEFAVLLEGFHKPGEVISVARRCCIAMDQPFSISEKSIYTGASIGVVLRPDGGQSPQELLRQADVAMYRAKESGGNMFKVFNRTMLNSSFMATNLDSEMRRALEQQQFTLHYQPIMDLSGGGLCGFEALVRWNHPDRGCVSPAEFILQAEESGFIEPLGEWVLYEACRQLRAWHDRFPSAASLSMNVNLSPRQMRLESLPQSVESALRATGLTPSSLQLELSEASMMANMKRCSQLLEQLKSMDLQLLIDDFGIGYSSLSFLQQFPIDYLKIDRSFICNNGSHSMAKPELVNMVVALARSMNIKTVAEGVEHQSQAEELRRLECGLAQGYLFAPPLQCCDAEALLAGVADVIPCRA